MNLLLHTDLGSNWSNVRRLRRLTSELMDDCTEQLRSGTALTVSELVENAIKYGDSAKGHTPIQLTLKIDDRTVQVTVKNPCTNLVGVSNLRQHVKRISGGGERTAAYLERLADLMVDTERNARLGLFRIYSEGGFDLDFVYENDMVEMRASRSIR